MTNLQAQNDVSMSAELRQVANGFAYRVKSFGAYDVNGYLLSVETHRRAATGNTKSREVAGALASTAPSSTARKFRHAPGGCVKAGRAT